MDNLEEQAHQLKGQTVIFEKDGEIAIKDSNGNISLEKDQPQSILASLLYKLTIEDKAIWVRRQVDPNYFYCFVNNEKVIVEVIIDEDDDGVNCLERSHVVFSIRYRDADFMYFGGVCNGDKILEIIKLIPDPIDDKKFQKLNKIWFDHWQFHLLDDLTAYKNSLAK